MPSWNFLVVSLELLISTRYVERNSIMYLNFIRLGSFRHETLELSVLRTLGIIYFLLAIKSVSSGEYYAKSSVLNPPSGFFNYLRKYFSFLLRNSNRKWNYPNRKRNNLSYFHNSDQNNFFQNGFWKQEVELFNRKWNVFLTSSPHIKNLLSQNISPFIMESKIGFQDRNWNYVNRTFNYFPYLQASGKKNFFCKMFFILTPSNPGSVRGWLSRGGRSAPPPTKSMKEGRRTPSCYLEVGPL